uniref:Fe2OG dioxygenase domain-containing protein n=1 Tax=Davidia involucrata TaxID=16924 RepID=A0A5B7B679_DAVIN
MAAVVGYDRLKEVKEFDNSKIGVKGLSDSGITTIPNIFVHPPEALSDLKKSSSTCTEVPLIDLSGVNSDLHRPKIVEQISEAARTWGFFQLINHGVPVSALDGMIAAYKAFFEQPTEEKAKHHSREESHGVMYASNNDLYRSKVATWHDTLQIWRAPEPAKEEDIPAVCRREVVEWDVHAKKLAETLMELLCEGLGLEGGKLKELGYSETRAIVGHCYPYCPQPDLTVGLGAHSDYGVLTVLLQNEVYGLQVKHGDGWVDVKPLPGSLTINVGDTLQIISNGEYKSVEHRVLANSSTEPRISIIEFFNADNRDKLRVHGPLPELLTPEKPAIYRNFTFPEFIKNFFSKPFGTKALVENFLL